MSSALLHRRVAGVLVAAMLCLLGGVVTGAAANAATGPAHTVVKYCDPPGHDPVVERETVRTPNCELGTATVDTITRTWYFHDEGYWAGPFWNRYWVENWVMDSEPTVTHDPHQVSLTLDEAATCAGEKPEPLREPESFGGAPDCDNPEVLLGDRVYETEYVMDAGAVPPVWVLGERVLVEDTTHTVSLTPEELAACNVPARPDPLKEVLSHGGAPTCATPTVMLGTVTMTTDYVLNEANEWVLGTPVELDERVPVSLTAAELAACVPTQPTQPTVPTAPTAPTASLALAETGGPALLPVLTALGLTLLGAAGIVARRRLSE